MGALNQLSKFAFGICCLIQVERIDSQLENPFASLVNEQSIVIVPEFELESGVRLRQVPVAYKTWGKLNAERSNVLIICHALSGSADVEDWYIVVSPGLNLLGGDHLSVLGRLSIRPSSLYSVETLWVRLMDLLLLSQSILTLERIMDLNFHSSQFVMMSSILASHTYTNN